MKQEDATSRQTDVDLLTSDVVMIYNSEGEFKGETQNIFAASLVNIGHAYIIHDGAIGMFEEEKEA